MEKHWNDNQKRLLVVPSGNKDPTTIKMKKKKKYVGLKESS